MAGVRQKSPALLQNQRGGRGRVFEVVTRGTRKAPPAPKGITPQARKVWREFWSTWISDAVNYEAHGERLRWWIHCVDERWRLEKLVTATPLVKGSHGQLMLNPLQRRIDRLTRDIERAEEAYGMTPLATWRMQLTATEAKRSANDLRRELMTPVSRTDDGVIDLDALE